MVTSLDTVAALALAFFPIKILFVPVVISLVPEFPAQLPIKVL